MPDTVFITDAAINIAPDLDAKRDIIQNVVDLYNLAGFGTTPRVAILSAVETVTSKNSVHHRGGCAVQDGRPRTDHRRPAGRTSGI